MSNYEDESENNKKESIVKFEDLGNFSKLPDRMLEDFGIIKTGIFGLICSRANWIGYSFISQNSISRMFKISRNTVSKVIKELVDMELLFIHPWPKILPKELKNIDTRVILYVPNIIKYQSMYPPKVDGKEEKISYEDRLAMLFEHVKKDVSENPIAPI
jgi:predicted XRE-type DNA-binding protein